MKKIKKIAFKYVTLEGNCARNRVNHPGAACRTVGRVRFCYVANVLFLCIFLNIYKYSPKARCGAMLRHLFSRRTRSPGPLNKSSSLFLLRGKRHHHSWVLGVISSWKMREQIRRFRLSQQVKWESKKQVIVKLEGVRNSGQDFLLLEKNQKTKVKKQKQTNKQDPLF